MRRASTPSVSRALPFPRLLEEYGEAIISLVSQIVNGVNSFGVSSFFDFGGSRVLTFQPGQGEGHGDPGVYLRRKSESSRPLLGRDGAYGIAAGQRHLDPSKGAPMNSRGRHQPSRRSDSSEIRFCPRCGGARQAQYAAAPTNVCRCPKEQPAGHEGRRADQADDGSRQ